VPYPPGDAVLAWYRRRGPVINAGIAGLGTHRIGDLWPAPHEFIPFSAGLHRCVGSAMATTEMTVMLARLVARTTLRLPFQRSSARNFAALRPWPGLTVEIQSIK
jgi:cytochrome P450